MLVNDRSLTNQKDGLNNSLNRILTSGGRKNEEKNNVLAGRSFSKRGKSRSRARFDFPPFLRPATQVHSGTNFVLNVIFTMLKIAAVKDHTVDHLSQQS